VFTARYEMNLHITSSPCQFMALWGRNVPVAGVSRQLNFTR